MSKKSTLAVISIILLSFLTVSTAATPTPSPDPTTPTTCFTSSTNKNNNGRCKKRADGMGDACVKIMIAFHNCYSHGYAI